MGHNARKLSLDVAGKPGLVKYVALIFVDESHDL
jgi:hypothetical protein